MSDATITELFLSPDLPPDTPAVLELRRDGRREMTRQELLASARHFAAELRGSGLHPGDRVALLAPNSGRWIAAALGVIQADGVIVPLDTQMPRDDLAHVLCDASPQLIITTGALAARIPERHARKHVYHLDAENPADVPMPPLAQAQQNVSTHPDDRLAAIFYTSGTTGPPKGVPLSHDNLCSNVNALCDQALADHTDRVLVPLPFHHVYPFTIGLLTPLALGATIVMPASLVGPQIARALRDGGATVLLGVPRLYETLWNALEERISRRGRLAWLLLKVALRISWLGHRLGRRPGRRLFTRLRQQLAPELRLMVAGGAALDPDLGRRLLALGWEVGTGYGLTETSPILTYNPPHALKIESVGLPLPGVEIAIDGATEASGAGEVLARGPNVFRGYWNLPEKTRESFTEGGWFRTGDQGSVDSEGYLHLHGRASSMIVLAGGENVNPERVEELLERADGVREVGVLEHAGRLAAVVVPHPGPMDRLEPAALRECVSEAIGQVAAELPGHHRPSLLRISADPLPRTRLGKLRRHKLRERFDELGDADAPADLAPGPLPEERMSPEDRQLLSDPAAERTWRYLGERFSDRRLTPDSRLAADLGLDSLSWVDLNLTLRERIGIELDDAAISRVDTIRDLLREASGAAGTEHAGESLVEELQDPETLLEPEQRSTLARRGPLRYAAAHVFLAIARFAGQMLARIEIRGHVPAGGPYLITPRHLSLVDPLVLLRAFSRQQLASTYWAGWTGILFSSRWRRAFSRTAGVLPIDPATAPRVSLALAASCLQRGHNLIWFPEGQRSPDGTLQPFRPGIGLLLRAQPVPVIPVWIEGTRSVLPPGRLLPRPGRVLIHIGEPVTAQTYGSDVHHIVEVIQERVAALESLGDPDEAS